VYEGFKWYTPGINGFVDVADVAKATILLMESSVSEQRFIINGDNWSFKKLQDTIAEGFGNKKPSLKTTPFLLAIAWRLEKIKSFFTRKKPLLTKESARVAQSQTMFENGKLLKAFPEFSYTPLEDSIQKACKMYVARNQTMQL
jgi:nucleoside-diphosphate-sugar epimerase